MLILSWWRPSMALPDFRSSGRINHFICQVDSVTCLFLDFSTLIPWLEMKEPKYLQKCGVFLVSLLMFHIWLLILQNFEWCVWKRRSLVSLKRCLVWFWVLVELWSEWIVWWEAWLEHIAAYSQAVIDCNQIKFHVTSLRLTGLCQLNL